MIAVKSSLKNRILASIYSEFDQWLSQVNVVCAKGCSSCCTRNVTMTSLEGEYMLSSIRDGNKEKWLSRALAGVNFVSQPGLTTNEFVVGCLEDNDSESAQAAHSSEACPFLVDQGCPIYEARPLSCRCFVSQKKCGLNQAAVVPDYILTGSTTVMQIIEHLDQKGQWGNMLDILRLHSANPKDNSEIRERLRNCKPSPGFLIPPEDLEQVQPLLESIFSVKIDGKRVETFLNGG